MEATMHSKYTQSYEQLASLRPWSSSSVLKYAGSIQGIITNDTMYTLVCIKQQVYKISRLLDSKTWMNALSCLFLLELTMIYYWNGWRQQADEIIANDNVIMWNRALAGPWIFFQIFKAWKVLENRHGPWKSLNLCLKVVESDWIWFYKMPWPNQLILKNVFQMASFWPQMCIKSIFGRGFAPDPSRWAYDTYICL